MDLVTGISNQPAQVFNLTPSDGSTATITLAYRPQQKGWFFDLTWNGTNPATTINGFRLSTFPNVLRQFRNVLSFGLACVTADDQEPMGQDDFSSAYARLYLLTPEDVANVEALVFPGE